MFPLFGCPEVLYLQVLVLFLLLFMSLIILSKALLL